MKLSLILFFGFLSKAIYSHDVLIFEAPMAEIPVEFLDLVSLDTKDQIYASNTSGDIYLFDQKGKQINVYSPTRQARLHQLEASWTVNIFGFSADLQEYRVLDRFLNPIAENNFQLNEVTLPKAATLGNNNVIWVWDESDLSLKTLDYLRNLVIQSQPLNLILDSEDLKVSEIREFKNRLFMNVPDSGIFIFDNQGNFLKKVTLMIDQRMCFYKESLFWVEGRSLKMYSLQSQAIFDLGTLPSKDVQYLQIGQEHIALVKKNLISIYPLPQGLRQMK
ncbi:hypothetical protein J0A67_00385 [Algoriphagus aestuariicola]|uniref:Uncharacterized protein n=1 Tax=Algoriphagus aestuariicola TaxID=1852016 RepID=A0ABS3BK22_9BACT|nr:hypothetical protein [Algoriphagus aestuariicola]MBN7799291.1 hypothetical protein [Algoriphagus aestuariicola]